MSNAGENSHASSILDDVQQPLLGERVPVVDINDYFGCWASFFRAAKTARDAVLSCLTETVTAAYGDGPNPLP